MFNKKVLKMVGMLFFLMALFYFISNNNKKFPKDVPEEFKCDKRLPHEKNNFWDGK